MIRVRRANPRSMQDLCDIAWLQQQCLPWDKPADPRTGWWWIARENGRPVAFAAMVPSSQWGDAVYFNRAGVAPDCRGKGLQKRLIRVRIHAARRLGFRWAITDTTHNPASANSLVACRFRMFEPTKRWAWRHSLYFRLRLA